MYKLALLLVLTATAVFALEDTPANREQEAKRYLDATPPKELFANVAQQVSQNLPAEQRGQFRDLLTKHLDIDALSAAMKDAMVRNFSADELKALADFYGSPVGKSAMGKFPRYMADVMPAIQTELQKAMAKAKANPEKPDQPQQP